MMIFHPYYKYERNIKKGDHLKQAIWRICGLKLRKNLAWTNSVPFRDKKKYLMHLPEKVHNVLRK